MTVLDSLRDLFRPALVSVGTAADKVSGYLEMVKPSSDAKNGDYQANFAMALAKSLGQKPPELAKAIVAAIPANDVIEATTVAGPGFINVTIKSDWLAKRVSALAGDPRLGVAPASSPKSFVIDLSGPNVAKPLHVGHLRSTIIGDALVHLLRFLGHTVVGDNHVGDWGTQFGILLYGYKHHRDDAAYQADPVRELARLYIHVRNLAKVVGDEDEGTGDVMEACRQETAKLHAGDPENVALWQQFMPACLAMLQPIYDRLDVKIDVTLGESFYNPMLPTLVEELLNKKLACNSFGTIIIPNQTGNFVPTSDAVFPNQDIFERAANELTDVQSATVEQLFLFVQNHANEYYKSVDNYLWNGWLLANANKVYSKCSIQKKSEIAAYTSEHSGDRLGHNMNFLVRLDAKFLVEPPAIIRKSDGAYTYTTTDLATIKYRIGRWDPDCMLYVVDARQSLHFRTLFGNVDRWIFKNEIAWGSKPVKLMHVAFGSILGKDKKPFKTRDGGTIELASLLDEAAALGLQRYEQSLADRKEHGHDVANLTDADKKEIAEAIGYGAVKYADLSGNRTSDYTFDYDKMLATDGNTATYMQYAYARCKSILRRGEVDEAKLRANPPAVTLEHSMERALALQLVRFPESLNAAAAEYLPHLITTYLWDLAKSFSGFFEACPVLKAEHESLKMSRLLLVDLVGRTVKQALDLLGIRTVERM